MRNLIKNEDCNNNFMVLIKLLYWLSNLAILWYLIVGVIIFYHQCSHHVSLFNNSCMNAYFMAKTHLVSYYLIDISILIIPLITNFFLKNYYIRLAMNLAFIAVFFHTDFIKYLSYQLSRIIL